MSRRSDTQVRTFFIKEGADIYVYTYYSESNGWRRETLLDFNQRWRGSWRGHVGQSVERIERTLT